MIEYPATFPLPTDKFGEDTSPFAIRTQMESGRSRQRKRWQNAYTRITLEFELSTVEFYKWSTWAQNNAYDWFTMPLDIVQGNRVERDIRFITPTQYKYKNWDTVVVTVVAEESNVLANPDPIPPYLEGVSSCSVWTNGLGSGTPEAFKSYVLTTGHITPEYNIGGGSLTNFVADASGKMYSVEYESTNKANYNRYLTSIDNGATWQQVPIPVDHIAYSGARSNGGTGITAYKTAYNGGVSLRINNLFRAGDGNVYASFGISLSSVNYGCSYRGILNLTTQSVVQTCAWDRYIEANVGYGGSFNFAPLTGSDYFTASPVTRGQTIYQVGLGANVNDASYCMGVSRANSSNGNHLVSFAIGGSAKTMGESAVVGNWLYFTFSKTTGAGGTTGLLAHNLTAGIQNPNGPYVWDTPEAQYVGSLSSTIQWLDPNATDDLVGTTIWSGRNNATYPYTFGGGPGTLGGSGWDAIDTGRTVIGPWLVTDSFLLAPISSTQAAKFTGSSYTTLDYSSTFEEVMPAAWTASQVASFAVRQALDGTFFLVIVMKNTQSYRICISRSASGLPNSFSGAFWYSTPHINTTAGNISVEMLDGVLHVCSRAAANQNAISVYTFTGLEYTCCDPPTVGQIQPSAFDVTAYPTSITWTAYASGTEPFTYVWKKNGVTIGGATSSSYTKVVNSSADIGTFSVTVTGACGSATSSATVTTSVYEQPVPTITVDPTGIPYFGGSLPITITATVTNSPASDPITAWSWFFWDFITPGPVLISGATTNAYSTTITSSSQLGLYIAYATNAAGVSTGATCNVFAV